MRTLKDRIRFLVETFHGGSIKRASREFGIAQPTLSRIYNGKIKSPRVDLLQRIAQYHFTTVDWLVTGRGEPPMSEAPEYLHGEPAARAAFEDFNRVARQLVSIHESVRLIRSLPFSSAGAAIHPVADDELTEEQQKAVNAVLQRLNINSVGLNAAIWRDALASLIAIVGVERASLYMVALIKIVCMYDEQFLNWLRDRGHFPKDMIALYQAFVAEQVAAEASTQREPRGAGAAAEIEKSPRTVKRARRAREKR